MDKKEEEVQFKDYLRILLRRKWVFITFLVVIVTITTLGTFRQTPIFRATTSILIEKESPSVVGVKEVVALGERYDYEDYYNTQCKIIQSRNIAEKTLQKLGGVEVVFPPREKGSLEEVKNPIDSFMKLISVEPIRNSQLVKINVEHQNPEKVALIANTLSEVFVEENLGRKVRASLDAQKWLLNQLKDLEGKVERSEMALEAYKKRNKLISLKESQNIIVKRLSELNSAFTSAQNERIRAESNYERLKEILKEGEKDLSSLESLPAIVENSLIQNLKMDYINLEARYEKLLDKYKPEHPTMIRLKSQIETTKKKMFDEVNKIAKSYEIEYQASCAREKAIKESLNQQEKKALGLNEKAVKYGILKRESETNQRMYNMVLERAKETGLSETIKTNNISILDRAKIPTSPIKPRKKLNVLLSIIVGLIGGTGLAFFTDYLDNTVKSEEELKELGLPCLGTIPHIKLKGDIKKDKIALDKTKSNIAEAYRVIRTNILFTSPDVPLKNLLITSAGPGEGKTITLTNLGIVHSRLGKKVLLVDTDLRRPQLHKIFNLSGAKGLTNFLSGEFSLEEVISPTEIENLSVITSGKIPPNPSELLGSQKMKEFIEEAGKRFDLIFYDSPPIFPVTDSVILSGLMDGVIDVIRSGKTPKELAIRAKEILAETRSKFIGVVLNDMVLQKSSCYYYYYHRYYKQEGQDTRA